MLYPPLRNVIGGLAFSQLIGVLKDLTSLESLTTYECLELACQNKVCAFVFVLTYKALKVQLIQDDNLFSGFTYPDTVA